VVFSGEHISCLLTLQEKKIVFILGAFVICFVNNCEYAEEKRKKEKEKEKERDGTTS
jgi:hypothetical protein